MTNLLLLTIVVLLLARIVLQVWQGKRAFENGYCAPSEVETKVSFLTDETYKDITSEIHRYEEAGFELVCAQSNVVIGGDTGTMLYFTSKKIKNYYDGKQ